MPLDAEVQKAARAFVSVLWHYDGLGGSVIQWTHENGSDHEDPSVLAWVLDPDGKMLANISREVYNPGTLVPVLNEHARTSFPLVDPDDYEALRKQARAIAARKKLGATVAELRALVAEGSEATPAERDEAGRLLAAISEHVEWKFERANEQKRTDPPATLALLRELSSAYKGDEIGARAETTLADLKKDEAFQAERKAHGRLAGVRGAAERFKPCSGDKTLRLKECEACRLKNGAALGDVVRALKGIVEKWPDTLAAERAAEMLDGWGLR